MQELRFTLVEKKPRDGGARLIFQWENESFHEYRLDMYAFVLWVYMCRIIGEKLK